MLGLATAQLSCCYRPVDGGAGEWGPWGACSATCAGGIGDPDPATRIRERRCDSPPPQFGGEECQVLTEEEDCTDRLPSCPGEDNIWEKMDR